MPILGNEQKVFPGKPLPGRKMLMLDPEKGIILMRLENLRHRGPLSSERTEDGSVGAFRSCSAQISHLPVEDP